MNTHTTAKLVLCFGMHATAKRISTTELRLELTDLSLIVCLGPIIGQLGRAGAEGYAKVIERSGIRVDGIEHGEASAEFNYKRLYFGVLSRDNPGPNGFNIEYFKI